VHGLIGQVRGEREQEEQRGQDQPGAAEKPVPRRLPRPISAGGVGRLHLGLCLHAPILLVRGRSRVADLRSTGAPGARAPVCRLLDEWQPSLAAIWRQLALPLWRATGIVCPM